VSEKSQRKTALSGSKSTNFNKTSTKVQHFPTGSLCVGEVAKLLNKSSMTVTRWCQSGQLPAIEVSYGGKTSYRINPLAVELKLAELKKKSQPKVHKLEQATLSHVELIPAWISTLESGTLTGKVYSPLSVRTMTFTPGTL